METKSTNIGMTYGLISGLASVIFGLLLYLNGAKSFVSPIAWLGFAIPIVVAVLAAAKQKKTNGGYLDFAAALKVIFTTFVIGTVISSFFNYILLNFIDIPFREALAQESTEKMQEMMQKFGAPQDAIDKATEESLKGNNYTLGKTSLSAAFLCIFWFIVSLIIAAIIKKKKPEFPAAQ
ncbi:hypothetical protein DC498_06450 [Terrimonas sp.]|uniref:DUF4199 domain-containing protein n=1 Tax=Terrimonas sp. TaxID=1914338 RepID=UPI000D518DDF|nr:DUF4199 domain-containing protein [Terrimonas sp.]PVD53003.1 hypothetical protein DC498_06450 [Terrimonas sp.]